MMRALLTLGFALVLVGACLAETKITGATAVPEHKLVRLEATGQDPNAALVWRIYPPRKADKATTPKNKLEFVAPPGTYVVDLLAIRVNGGAVEVEESQVTVTVVAADGTREPTACCSSAGCKCFDKCKCSDAKRCSAECKCQKKEKVTE